MTLIRLLLFAALSLGAACPARCPAADVYDLIIRGGRVADGTGAPWYRADVGVSDGSIAAIGSLAEADAERIIDAEGLIVAPGFIDLMGQTATPMLEDPDTAVNLLSQGITTINAGEGASAAPLNADEEVRFGWQTMGDYFQLLDLKGLPVNVVQTVGHTQVRRLVMGEVDRRPTAGELSRMQALVREGMEAGAIGVSTALIYPPAVYAETEEIAALAKVAAEYGGRYYTHMRNEGDLLLPAIDEALDIGRQSGAPVHIFHLKAAGRQNWSAMPLAIARIRQARAAGQQVTADIYPYINNGLGIAALIHPRHFAEGRAVLLRRLGDDALRSEIREEMESTDGWENWYRHVGRDWNRIVIGQASGDDAQYAGKTLAEIAAARQEDPWETFFRLVRSGAFALPQSMTEANKILALQQEFVSFCTDVGPAGGADRASHPRAYGSFPRLLSRYVRDLGAVSLEQAVSQASAAAANAVQAFDRGRIAPGLAADIAIFDLDALTDNATFANPHALSEGIRYVLVNGELAWEDGRQTDRRPGRVLRGPGFTASAAASGQAEGTDDPVFRDVNATVERFLDEHRVPGIAVAITRGDRIIYARGFGYADVGARERVSPDSLFRIASVSKPVTAVAVMQLVEQSRLDLDTPVFDILTGDDGAADFADPRQRQITVRHLLQHRGGWDRSVSFDAMFRPVRFAEAAGARPPAGPVEIMRAMRAEPLDFAPGERYAYSNYGYCLLGRVIEVVSGRPYAEFVQDNVLQPCGIERMRIGGSRLADRQPGEVRYYDTGRSQSVFHEDLGRRVPAMYGAWHLEAMDAHGAWIASCTDLARFAIRCRPQAARPLLKATTWQEITRRPDGAAGHADDGSPKSTFYGLGWSVTEAADGQQTLTHSGSLPGTNTRLTLRPDGSAVIVLSNSRTSRLAGRVVDALLSDLNPKIDALPSDL